MSKFLPKFLRGFGLSFKPAFSSKYNFQPSAQSIVPLYAPESSKNEAEEAHNSGRELISFPGSDLDSSTSQWRQVGSVTKQKTAAAAFALKARATKNIDLEEQQEMGEELLLLITNNEPEEAERLLSQALTGQAPVPNLECMDDSKNTALHLAVQNQYETLTEMLLKLGAKTDMLNANNQTPLDVARHLKADGLAARGPQVLFPDAHAVHPKTTSSLKEPREKSSNQPGRDLNYYIELLLSYIVKGEAVNEEIMGDMEAEEELPTGWQVM